ncbi:MAG TPA: universal stress protein [Anaerolineae bacterium]|nr:universal stress protein [Anaerolineae bacterium]
MKILLTTRGAPHDEVALAFGAYIAQSADEPVTVLSVAEHASKRPEAEAALEQARELLQGIAVTAKVRMGHASREIVAEAEEGKYNLVVVGENPNPNLVVRLLDGSDTIRVVEHAPCPVIVAKRKTGPVVRILVCDSGAEGPLAKLGPVAPAQPTSVPSLLARFTAQLADLLRGEEEVTVLHVMSQICAAPGIQDSDLQAEAEELIEGHTPEGEVLEQDIHALEHPGVRVWPKIRHGLVVDEILAEAQEGRYDLVVIGAHRGAGWQRILLDDIAHKILVQMDRPVLVVR